MSPRNRLILYIIEVESSNLSLGAKLITMKAEKQIIIPFSEWEDCEYRTLTWEQSVDMKRWECDYVNKIYIIDYNELKTK